MLTSPCSPTSRSLARAPLGSPRGASALVVAGMLALAGCADDATSAATTTATSSGPPTSEVPTSTAPPTTPAASPPTTSPPTTSPPTTVAPTTVVPTTVAPTSVPPTTRAPSDADCLVGAWVVTDEVLDSYFDVVAENAAFDSIENDGVMRFSFSGTTHVRVLDMTLTMRLAGSVYGAVGDLTTSQDYSVVDGQLQSSGPPRFDGTVTFTKDGLPFDEDPGDLFVGIIPLADLDYFSYSCDGPTVTIGAGPGLDDRYELQLTAE